MQLSQAFDVLGLPVTWQLSELQITQAYRKVMAACHPDRFLQAPESEHQQALEKSQNAAQAQKILRDPYQRACACYQAWHAHEVELPLPDHAFLARHMDQQMAMAELHDPEAWQQAAQQLERQSNTWHDEAAMFFVPDSSTDLFLAHLAQWPYLSRLNEALEQRKPS